MGETTFTVSYHVEEHPHREVDSVSVDTENLPENVSVEERIVELICERAVYTHSETISISEYAVPEPN